MKRLTVLYDANCELCRGARAWLAAQPKHVEMIYVPACSPDARARFPDLDHAATLGELTVVGDDGSLWRGAKAWITCLWALVEYRGWALALVESGRLEHARDIVAAVSRNRHRLGWAGRILSPS
jgi:predicted DCC family thiol-disulfide oxidoreductase YuxK